MMELTNKFPEQWTYLCLFMHQDFQKESVLLEGAQVSAVCPSVKSSLDDKMKMSMEQWWNDTARGKAKYTEKNTTQCHSVHHKHNRNYLSKLCIQLQFLPHREHRLYQFERNRLMQLRGKLGICSQNHTKHTNTLCEKTEVPLGYSGWCGGLPQDFKS
jgi:hypothetical protein